MARATRPDGKPARTGTRRAASLVVALLTASALSGCGFEEAPKPPLDSDVAEAMQAYVADTEGYTDIRGRYRGPRVLRVQDMKCDLTDEPSRTYKCAFKYMVRRNSTEEETATRLFRKVAVQVEENGKKVERRLWQIVGRG